MKQQEQFEQGEHEYIYGKNAIMELLKSGGGVDTLYVSDVHDKSVSHIVAMARQSGAVVKQTHPIKLASMAGNERHQGVVALCTVCTYSDIEDVFDWARQSGRPPFILIADGIEDPHNLGAIIRAAECAGVHGVVIPKRRGCAVTAAVYRASAGAVSHMLIVRATNLASLIRDIKERGVFCYCAEADGQLCYDTDLTGPAALVVGSEGFGVSRLVRELCDQTIRLPLYGSVNSLNASVAAGILMYEFVRQNGERERMLS